MYPYYSSLTSCSVVSAGQFIYSETDITALGGLSDKEQYFIVTLQLPYLVQEACRRLFYERSCCCRNKRQSKATDFTLHRTLPRLLQMAINHLLSSASQLSRTCSRQPIGLEHVAGVTTTWVSVNYRPLETDFDVVVVVVVVIIMQSAGTIASHHNNLDGRHVSTNQRVSRRIYISCCVYIKTPLYFQL